ncbi:hypothetical protein FM106_14355 [Brachybacterium faecium]|nr:hypothetical protein FM106_14355 [Brachybacterium faecium]
MSTIPYVNNLRVPFHKAIQKMTRICDRMLYRYRNSREK